MLTREEVELDMGRCHRTHVGRTEADARPRMATEGTMETYAARPAGYEGLGAVARATSEAGLSQVGPTKEARQSVGGVRPQAGGQRKTEDTA